MGKSCGKLLWENLAGISWRARRRGNGQFKKDSDWWKFSIWYRVMDSQQSGYSSGISHGKILWGNLAGKSCGKMSREIVVAKSCRK